MDPLNIAGKPYASRLLVGTGKYRDFEQTRAAIEASGAQIVTVAIRRTNIGQNPDQPNLLDAVPPSRYTILPNTAGCYSAEDAVRTLRLARELLEGQRLVKLEVLGDPRTLFPNVVETLSAAHTLVSEGFDVMVYTSDDPIVAKQLEEIGCVAVMPLASLIGSGMGISNPWNLQIIIENAKVPVLVDAGVGTASDAAIAMELGCDGVLMNTASGVSTVLCAPPRRGSLPPLRGKDRMGGEGAGSTREKGQGGRKPRSHTADPHPAPLSVRVRQAGPGLLHRAHRGEQLVGTDVADHPMRLVAARGEQDHGRHALDLVLLDQLGGGLVLLGDVGLDHVEAVGLAHDVGVDVGGVVHLAARDAPLGGEVDQQRLLAVRRAALASARAAPRRSPAWSPAGSASQTATATMRDADGAP